MSTSYFRYGWKIYFFMNSFIAGAAVLRVAVATLSGLQQPAALQQCGWSVASLPRPAPVTSNTSSCVFVDLES